MPIYKYYTAQGCLAQGIAVQAKTLSWIIDKERYVVKVKVYEPSKHDSRKDLANLRIHNYLFSIDLVEMYKGCRHDTQIIIFNFLYKLNFKIAWKKYVIDFSNFSIIIHFSDKYINKKQ